MHAGLCTAGGSSAACRWTWRRERVTEAGGPGGPDHELLVDLLGAGPHGGVGVHATRDEAVHLRGALPRHAVGRTESRVNFMVEGCAMHHRCIDVRSSHATDSTAPVCQWTVQMSSARMPVAPLMVDKQTV